MPTWEKCNVHDAFLSGKRCRRGNVFSEDSAIFSYGDHFPMALKNDDGSITVNQEKRSITTAKHLTMLRNSLSDAGYVPTNEASTLPGWWFRSRIDMPAIVWRKAQIGGSTDA